MPAAVRDRRRDRRGDGRRRRRSTARRSRQHDIEVHGDLGRRLDREPELHDRLNDVDEFDVSAPVDTNAAANAVDENAAIGTVVGITAFASDADATDQRGDLLADRQCRRRCSRSTPRPAW